MKNKLIETFGVGGFWAPTLAIAYLVALKGFEIHSMIAWAILWVLLMFGVVWPSWLAPRYHYSRELKQRNRQPRN